MYSRVTVIRGLKRDTVPLFEDLTVQYLEFERCKNRKLLRVPMSEISRTLS